MKCSPKSYETSYPFNEQNHLLHELQKFQLGSAYEHQETQFQIIHQVLNQQRKMVQKAEMLLMVCQQLKGSLVNLTEQIPLQVKNVRKVESQAEKELLLLSNKLKVCTQKVQRESHTNCIYNNNTYIQRVMKTLEFIQINEKRFQINETLKQLKQKFPTVSVNFLKKYKMNPASYLIPEGTVFCINFYITNLLFLDGTPLQFKSNLLYCPIILDENNFSRIEENGQKIYITISPYYLQQLQFYYPNWQNFVMTLVVKRNGRPYIYAKADSEGKYFNENMVCVFIRRLRRFIYLQLIQTWLWRVFGYKKEAFECDIRTQLTKQLTLQISVTKGKNEYLNRVQEQPALIQSFFKFFLKEDHMKRSRKEIKKLFVLYFNVSFVELTKSVRKSQDFFSNGKYIYYQNKMINTNQIN